jgi:acetolactate synthase small subunit
MLCVVIVLIADKSNSLERSAGFVMERGYIVTQLVVVPEATARYRDLQSVLVVLNR